MKRNIQLLSQQTINKIAAGEVVERPASVIKELVENAIDAMSTAVTVEIKDGGITYLRISDNGIGIPKEQVSTAFLRHSTSKIIDEVDLQTIGTLGFRGEALASIASVAQVEMMTKTRDELTGIRLVIEGGQIKVEEEVGCPEGTTIIVKNLFFNTPARKKFLKRPATEGTYIGDFMNRIALGHPEISFKYINKSKVSLHSSGNNKLKNAIFSVYGKNVVKDLIDFHVENDELSISGFIGKPAIARGNRTYESYYINGRYIKSKIIEKAIQDGYKDFIPPHSFPLLVLHIDMNPHEVDVNVHPTKMEVRFEDEDSIYELLYEGIKKALKGDNLIPEVSLDKEKLISKEAIEGYVPEAFEVKNKKVDALKVNKVTEIVRNAEHKIPQEAQNYKGISPTPSKTDQQVSSTPQEVTAQKEEVKAASKLPTGELEQQLDKPKVNPSMSGSEEPSTKVTLTDSTAVENKVIQDPTPQGVDTPVPKKSVETEQLDMAMNSMSKVFEEDFKIIGQLFKTYWIIEKGKQMFIVDQHAAHEKVMYERIKASRYEQNNTQILVSPIVVNLNEAEDLFLRKNQAVFKEFGFVIEEFGERDYILRGVPFIFNNNISQESFMIMLDSLVSEERHVKEEALYEKMALMSCKAAVKGNSRISYQEMQSLMEQLFTLENPYNCPHGRPTIISMSQYEIEKKFKRV